VSEMLPEVAMLTAPSSRSRIYLDLLERRGLLPELVLLLEDPSVETAEQRRRAAESVPSGTVLPEDPELNARRTVRQRVEDLGIDHRTLDTLNPNDRVVVEAVAEIDQEFLIYPGPGGIISEGDLLKAGPRFLHVHAGELPDYRGSTTIYYSLLAEGACGATAFLMNENIDEGPIVARESYPPPKNPETIDLYYDPWICARLLCKVLSLYRDEGDLPETPQRPNEGETYYILHPIVKHLAVSHIS
jgi:Methionyl-tRNA formyltransferase